MSGLRRSKLEAAFLFALIFAAVFGGMSWATVATVRLAEENIKTERDTKIARVLTGVKAYIDRVLATEAARPWMHYQATYYEDPISIRSRGGRQFNLDPNTYDVEVPSPLLPVSRSEDWRPYHWIDIYFQLDAHHQIISPQFPEEPEHVRFWTGVDPRTQAAWNTLQRLLPNYPIMEKTSEARRREWLKESCENDGGTVSTNVSSGATPPIDANQAEVASPGVLNVQAGHIPPEQCVDARVIARNIPIQGVTVVSAGLEDEPGISTRYSEIAPPFWLEPMPKLVFVREIQADAEVFRQGFIGDWERLRPELMKELLPTFHDAELVPDTTAITTPLAPNEYRVPTLPLILRVPEFAVAARTQAWQSTRQVLLISWIAGVAVLLVAGWGVMNLVSLTQRRMQFAYAVTHELRTPLTTFRLYSDMLSAGLVPEERKQEYLDTLNRESARLSTMVESVLEYARLENRHAKLHLRETDSNSLLHTVGETLDKRCSENGIEGKKINEVREGLKIRTDVDLVSQITGVLVNNAVRHARTSKQPRVTLRLGGENGKLTVDVMDSGPGVDRSDSRRIFKPFRRGRDADTAARGGIGLGLSLARDWASLLGGRLDLIHRHDPELGGAHFRLTIPSHARDT